FLYLYLLIIWGCACHGHTHTPLFLSFGQARHQPCCICSAPFGVGTQPIPSLGWHGFQHPSSILGRSFATRRQLKP
ncbi:hypothetical protein BJV77DRAFT_1027006, partial [Russula vinacea]